MRQLESDTQLLASCGVLDYSLLLGVHYRDRGPRDAAEAAEADPGNLSSFVEHRGELGEAGWGVVLVGWWHGYMLLTVWSTAV
jgi:hypothetical protein